MSLSYETMLDLMRYADADGELDADARARVEALLRTNDEARRVVDAMGTLGEVVREGVDQRVAKSAAADGIADAVMAAIARESRGARADDGALPVPAAPSAPIVELTVGRARRSRAGVTSAVIVVLALAAGVVLLVTGKAPAPVAKDEPVAPSSAPAEVGSTRTPESPSASAAALAEGEGHGVDLEEVRSVRNKVNVFFTPRTPVAGASVVVWIDDRPGGR